MKILAVSDTVVPELSGRFDPEPFTGVEAIFSCGDLEPEYLALLRDRINAPLYYVLGNHDLRCLQTPPMGCTCVHGRLVRVGGLRLIGLSGCRWYNGGPNQYREREMRRIIRGLWFSLLLNRGVDIVLSHAPPQGIHDRPDPCHQGFACFLRLLEKYRPGWFLHGHIHQNFTDHAQRITVAGTTRVINTCGHVLLDI